ncbi:MAG: glutamine-hydrolyzing carbamoyl-phosphate synthase small subunit [Coriobacteriia bacterium]|nr:glutamine-hydrolyzing carbamoyl-phosphate synthase small subunit [Coriobacteriia bacterium]
MTDLEVKASQSEEIDEVVSKMAILMLEDGSCFVGISKGIDGEALGEICFNTVMIGYPEVISDPSNAGQVVVITYPQVGNYGVALADVESEQIALRALVAREICETPSNYRSDMSLPEWLVEQGVVAIDGIDTRELTQLIRDRGSLRAIVSTIDSDPESLLAKVLAAPSIDRENLVASVSTKQPYLFSMNEEHRSWYQTIAEPRYKVIVIDLGVTRSILNSLSRLGAAVIVLPWDASAEEILAYQPDGVVFSSGPGDPRVLTSTITTCSDLLGKTALLGIGLGHQVMALAVGGGIIKMKAGHRGVNYPVKDIAADRVNITEQNHGFTVDFKSLGLLERPRKRVQTVANDSCGRIQLTETNLNDGTVEALLYLDIPAVSVQYQPQISIADNTTNAFNRFATMMKKGEPEDAPAAILTGDTKDSESENA